MRGRRAPRGDRGSVSAEMALIAPLLLTLAVFAIGAGRLVSARLDVADAAHQAARAASLARSPAAARQAAEGAARSALDGAGTSCTRLAVTADTSAFRPGGQVGVTLACTASLADLTMLPWTGDHTVSETFTVPLDIYRAGAAK